MIADEIKYCCIKCFSEQEIQNFIASFKEVGECDYCGNKEIDVAPVDEVGEFAFEGFLRKYEDAANEVSYCSADGGYQLPTNSITKILSDEEIFGDDLDDPSSLIEDLVNDDGTLYVRIDPYGSSDEGEYIASWDEFCKIVKTKYRFTSLTNVEDELSHSKNFLEMLTNRLSKTVVDELYPGQKIYRARIGKNNDNYNHKDLTSPPPEKASNSRMSPIGISLFYGGMNEDVCINEVRPSVGEIVYVAEFEVLKNLNILDLSAKFYEPYMSMFNKEYSYEFEEILKPFINYFVTEIAKPIRVSDSQIDYLPTQVFTEFLRRFRFQDHYFDSQSNSTFTIDGIKYRSSLMENGVNIVLFKGPDVSREKNDQKDDAWLLIKEIKKYKIGSIGLQYVLQI